MYTLVLIPFNSKNRNGFCTLPSMKIFKSLVIPVFAIALIASFAFTSNSKKKKDPPEVKSISFGKIKVDGTLYEHDIVIEGYEVRKRKKGPSKPFRADYNHTPLTHLEEIPWDCKVLVIGIGMSKRLPVTDEFKAMAKEKGVELIMKRTPDAVEYYNDNFTEDMNAIFHVTC